MFNIPQAYAARDAESLKTALGRTVINPVISKFLGVSDLLNSILPPLLTIAGLILFGMIIMGGFEMLTAASDAKKAEAGKGRITSAIIGFLIIFCAYWIVQILEIVLGVKILS